mmetsp:Transcript_147077/g.256824  ORF Transcript_147077/g.256824 Transcript_147077/m.256824 type:complete len:236 (-) Transcript_147077:434-1141(-)
MDGRLAVWVGGLRLPVRSMEQVPEPVRVAEVEGPDWLGLGVEQVTLLDTGESVQDLDGVQREVMDLVIANDRVPVGVNVYVPGVETASVGVTVNSRLGVRVGGLRVWVSEILGVCERLRVWVQEGDHVKVGEGVFEGSEGVAVTTGVGLKVGGVADGVLTRLRVGVGVTIAVRDHVADGEGGEAVKVSDRVRRPVSVQVLVGLGVTECESVRLEVEEWVQEVVTEAEPDTLREAV